MLKMAYFCLLSDLPSLPCITFCDEQVLYSSVRTSSNHPKHIQRMVWSFKSFERGAGIEIKQGDEWISAYQCLISLVWLWENLTWARAKKSWVSLNYANDSIHDPVCSCDNCFPYLSNSPCGPWTCARSRDLFWEWILHTDLKKSHYWILWRTDTETP